MGKSSIFKTNLAVFSGLSIATLHVINRLETTKACAGTRTRTREDKTYAWRYGNINYKVKGYGSPVLLLHDLTLGSSKYEYKYIYEELSKKFKVYVPDLPGYGDSDKPVMTYTASTFKDMLEDFIRNVIKTKTDVVVTGTTAPIILDLAHDDPKLLNSIIMINPLGLYDQNLIPSAQTKLLRLLMDIPVIGTFVYNMNATRPAIETTIRSLYFSNPDSYDQAKLNEMISEYFRSAHTGGIHAKYSHASYISQFMTCSILNDLKELDHSILIIGGADEPDIKDNIENYVYYNKAVESVMIENTSHLPQIERPEEVLKNIDVFLS